MRIAFVWQGMSGRYGQWRDGLWAAMQLIEKDGHDVEYFDTTETDDIVPFHPDVVLYWEAPCTLNGKDGDNYRAVLALPFKKALLFAGGAVTRETSYGFDLYFVESKINEEEFEELGLPWKRAFGVNTQIFHPRKQPKVFKAFMQATYATWKRHGLFASTFKSEGACAGRKQDNDITPPMLCEKYGTLALPELSADAIADMICASDVVVNTAEEWGGGQRCTLEAMACGVPVIVMSDSPKNCEFVEESNIGAIADPNAESISTAYLELKYGAKNNDGTAYVQSKWTERHYADAILEGIDSII